MHKSNETILEVNLSKLESNFNYLKSKLNSSTEIIAVIKAFAYGHGDVMIAKKLESLGVKKFWMADFEEGISLRKNGINSEIIIANPGTKSFEDIIENNLEVVIHNLRLLRFYGSKKINTSIHVKFNTGMNRYGFDREEMEEVITFLKDNSQLKVKSVCTHLSSADDLSKANITKKQISLFEEISNSFEKKLNLNVKKHLLNSNGLLHFPNKQFDYVRLGISLFGSFKNENLHQVSKLKSVISQNRNIKKGSSVGYSAEFIAPKNMNVSVVPVGYADGFNRRLGSGVGSVFVNNVECPIIGKICMDSFIIDTSNTNCKEGDEVEIFGGNNSILKLAEKINTIPYEIYSTLNRRIKRVYIGN